MQYFMRARIHKVGYAFWSNITIFAVLSFLFVPTAICSWQKIATLPGTVNCSFFFDESTGLVGMDGMTGIMKTTNGGKTWNSAIIPNGYTGLITDIFMIDSLHGWAGIEEGPLGRGLWSTSDGGLSWAINPNYLGAVASIYQTKKALIVTSRSAANGLSISTDGGVTFEQAGIDRYTGISFVDDLHGIVCTYVLGTGTGYAPAVVTTDCGISWSKTSGMQMEAWSALPVKGSSTFVIVGEMYALDPSVTESVYHSTNNGAAWQKVSTITGRTTGHVAGTGKIIFVQSDDGKITNTSGLWRSTDGGTTWINVGGPTNFRDTRFSVMGCNANIIYAFDEFGSVFKSTDGGDGLIGGSSPSIVLGTSTPTLKASACTRDSMSVQFGNLSCDSMTVQSIGFLDSSAKIIRSGALSFTSFPKLPEGLSVSSIDSISIIWDPSKIGTEALIDSSLVRIRVRLASGVLFDTIIQVQLVSKALQPSSYTDSLNFSTVTIGSQPCRTIVLRNTAPVGDAPFQLDKVSFTHSDPQFSFAFAPWPISIDPQDSIQIEICYTPTDKLLHRDSILIHTECFDFPIVVTGRGAYPEGIEEQKNYTHFSIRPNPTQTELIVQSDRITEGPIDVEISNSLGEIVYSQKHSLQSGRNEIKLLISRLQAGVYWIIVDGNRYKFIKS